MSTARRPCERSMPMTRCSCPQKVLCARLSRDRLDGRGTVGRSCKPASRARRRSCTSYVFCNDTLLYTGAVTSRCDGARLDLAVMLLPLVDIDPHTRHNCIFNAVACSQLCQRTIHSFCYSRLYLRSVSIDLCAVQVCTQLVCLMTPRPMRIHLPWAFPGQFYLF